MTSSWTSKMWIRDNGLPLFTTATTTKSRRAQCSANHLFYVSLIIVCLASSIIPQCHGFFFPKSFFRKGNENPPPHPPPQQHPRVLAGGNGGRPVQNQAFGGEHLQGSGTDVQPATRIVNRPPYHQPPRNNDQQQQASGPVPGSGFHVPRELCMACERFPWMPVAGERPAVGAASTSVSQSQKPQEQPRQPYFHQSQGSSPTKTIVINALGEAQGPVPIPPQLPSRRPFAIQFDANQSGNKVNYQDAPKQQPPQHQSPQPQQQQNLHQQQQQYSQQPQQQNPPKQERPVSFQIFQAQTSTQQQHQQQQHQQQQPTVLQQQHHPIGLQPPPVPQAYGPPTVLIPVNTQSAQVGANLHVQGNHGSAPPPNPLAVGTIVASQQQQQNNGQLPQFQKIEPAKLVYQEHFTAQASAPPSSPQNFKVPIIPHQKPASEIKQEHLATNNIIPQQQFPPQPNYGPPPQRPGGIFLQMRPPAPYQNQPPRPSLNMKPPVPVIHYGKPIRIPNNIGPQRPSGQVIFPPPQAFLQMGPPPPPHGQQPNGAYGVPRPEDERRPSPSGQILNVQHPTQTNRPPTHQPLNSNSIQPVPIPIPTVQDSVNNNNRPNKIESTFNQETGWEIIPSIQTDLTHLFSPEKGKAQGTKELPVPVPIPVPQSHPPKSPFFIVAGAGQQQQQQQEQIKVQDVTYHEESRNPVPSVSAPLNTISESGQQQSNEQQQQQQQQQQHQQQHSSLHTNSVENQQNVEQERRPQVPQQVIRTRPFILGLPTGPTRPVIFRAHPNQPFQQLHPSIMTALNHAQQTSLLTHQYFRQPQNVGQANTIYVSPVVNPTAASNAQQQVQQLQANNALVGESTSNSVQQETHEANNLDEGSQQHQQQNYGIDPRIPTSQAVVDQNNPNCQHNQQQRQPWLIPITTHQKEQQQQNQEVEQVATTAVDQSITPGQDDQSQGNTGKDDLKEDDGSSSSPDSLSPEPTYATSLASAPPTAATTTFVTNTPGGIRGQISVQDNGNKGSYVIYYPRPISKSPVYWVQPSRTVTQGVVRLNPQVTPVSPPVGSVVTWSRPRVVVANQFRAQQQPQEEQQGRYEDPANSDEANRSQASYERGEEHGSEEQAQSAQVSTEHDHNDDENIPFGQKLGVTRDSNRIQKPYDIISVGGSDDEAQSLEETSVSSDHSQGLESVEQSGKEQFGDTEYSPSGQDAGSTGTDNDNVDANSGPSREYPEAAQEQQSQQNENNLQSVQQETKDEDADDERDDFGYRPQTTFRKPISTTVIHSPGASSFQSLKLPNFKPHRVIVHDFTTHTGNAAATGPSAAASENQESVESSKGQSFSSETTASAWTASQKLKSPKLVESSDDEEESSESIHRPQGFNIQEVIASGPVSNADCLTTAHSGHLLTSFSSTSPRTAESVGTSAKGRDIFLPLGSRFPAGRPSIFSTLRRPISPPVSVPTTTTTTTTTAPSSTSESTQESFSPSTNKRERYLGQSPSGFAASIAVPVYRRPISIHHVAQNPVESSNNLHGSDSITYVKPQANVIQSTEDIYKPSEERVVDNASNNDPIKIVESSTSVSTSSTESEAIDSQDEIMSTEKSSSFSVSVVDEKSGGFSNNRDERGFQVSFGNNDISQQVGTKSRSKVVQVTSVPVITEAEPITTTTARIASSSSSSSANGLPSTTAIPSPASTSTKIVKTVRVRQRMRSGSLNGPLRTRFHGGGRVRVVHRPANQEYIRHFPEFATQEGDKLAKEEEQEVKNALIELKKSTEPVKTH